MTKPRKFVNRGFRIQYNSALGPYKGGIRFHSSVTQDSLKFLSFEQTFKNSLTTPFSGDGGGWLILTPRCRPNSGRSGRSFINELYHHIGYHTDIPAGDLGCGAREIGYMFGQYKKLTNDFTGAFTGRKPNWGGSLLRPEATGYGVAYFAQNMLKDRDSLEGNTAIISGTGNVGIFAIEKLTQLGAKVVGFMDYDGSVYDPNGVDAEKLAFLKDLVFVRRGSLLEYDKQFKGAHFRPGKKTRYSMPAPAPPLMVEKRIGTRRRRKPRCWKTAAPACAKAPTCPARPKPLTRLKRPTLCIPPAKRPTPAAWPYPAWK